LARKILLADDSVTAQNMGRKILSDAGYDVVTVNNGSAALKRVAEQRPDLIVLDVYMPGYSGLEVCQRLKDSPETEGIPILLTVGKLEPFKADEAKRVRAEAYIVKPFEASELLSALTRLEDQVVPGQGKNGKSGDHGDSDTGWKNRLRFPSKKKKVDPEPEADVDFVGGSGLRSAQSGKPAGNVISGKSTPSSAEAIPDIPRDITPEELDALSALAAKLDGEAPGPQEPAPAQSVAASDGRKEFEVEAPAVQEKAALSPADQTEVQAAPVAVAEPAAETSAPEAAPVPSETKEAEVAEIVPIRVETLAEKEPAPVDRSDEPMFAAVAAPDEPTAIEKVEVQQSEAASLAATASTSAVAPFEVQAKAEEIKSEPAPGTESSTAEIASEQPAKVEVPATAADATSQEERESPAPSEQELAEALRLLTPSATSPSSVPSQENLAAAGAALAEEAARCASSVSHWTAVAVSVDPEEAARSLEEEMFETMANSAAADGPEAETMPPAVAEAQSAKREAKENIEDAALADEPAAVTFADAVRHDEEPVSTSSGAEAKGKDSGSEASLQATETKKDSTLKAAGGNDDMGKESGKNGKSKAPQIRNAAAAVKDTVEATKQAEPVTQESPKAMAAAADGAPKPVPDPNAIANIVDSVLADLRPKIVEEISKKLSGK
jgi:CheY-like chemotaxis protein